jgi:hypothetical protein
MCRSHGHPLWRARGIVFRRRRPRSFNRPSDRLLSAGLISMRFESTNRFSELQECYRMTLRERRPGRGGVPRPPAPPTLPTRPEDSLWRQRSSSSQGRRWWNASRGAGGPIGEMRTRASRTWPGHRTVSGQAFLGFVDSFDGPQPKMTADCFMCAFGIVGKAVDTFVLGSRTSHGKGGPMHCLRTNKSCS